MTTLTDIRHRALASLIPPPRLTLSDWIERHIRLPEGISALPGPIQLWPYQREIADVISNPEIERVTLVKGVRLGFTTLLTSALASFVANEPCPVLVLLPTESDARDYIVSDVEPIFQASRVVRGTLSADVEEGERNTLLHRRFPGGSLKIVAARAPRNLRRHTARVLFIDEADAMEIGAEGNPIMLAERRTLSFADRKIVLGSTPLHDDTSHALRAYAASDQRVFELPCPECGGFTEILWGNVEWQPDRPDTAQFRCPHCQAFIAEKHKAAMVAQGRWRATKPDIKGHAGFRLNALVSLLANASWGKLAAEFLKAKEDSDDLQVFTNTILAQGWREAAEEVDDAALQSRAEDFSLNYIPEEVLCITCGVDVQDDRLECTIAGWTRANDCLVLAHEVIWGSPSDETTWREMDELLRTRWKHPLGGQIRIEATAIDSGDGDHVDFVYGYCFPRLSSRVMAIKGVFGSRPALEASKSAIGGGRTAGRLFLVGVDTLKGQLLTRLARGNTIRFSNTLQPSYYEQLSSERRVVRYKRGMPVRRFERKAGARAEALDALVYATAARQAVNLHVDARERELANTEPPAPQRTPTRRAMRSSFMD
jgi:phage terminase large subunit GpA-like protein